MISSTVLDLPGYRAAAEDAVLRMSMEPRLMERLPPGAGNALERSMRLVDDSELYVAILAERYGSICPGSAKSYTHLELERAAKRRLPVLLLMSPEPTTSTAALDPRVNDLRAWAADTFGFIPGEEHFHSVDDMRWKLVLGLFDRYRRLGAAAVGNVIGRVPTPPAPYAVHPYSLSGNGLIGRDAELGELSAWLRSADPIMQVDAIGGIGKTALLWESFRRAIMIGGLDGTFWWSFYEGDTSLEELVVRALAYVGVSSPAAVRRMEPVDRVETLLAILDSGRYLLVLDGLERAFRQYADNDAAFVSDAEIRRAPSALWHPGGASLDFDQLAATRRLRAAADPHLGAFLRSLSRSRGAKTIISTRNPSWDLELESGRPMPGVRRMNLGGLSSADGSAVWERAAGLPADELVREVLASLDFHPLSIRALAAAVGSYRPAPGNFGRWLADHPDFAAHVRSGRSGEHVLELAMRGLSALELEVIKPIAWSAQSCSFEELTGAAPDAPSLDLALAGLEDRGLLGWDRVQNRYDLHPIVRATVRDLTGYQAEPFLSRPDAQIERTPDIGLIARGLDGLPAPFADDLPTRVRLLDLLDLDHPTGAAIRRVWDRVPRSTEVVLGRGQDGIVTVNLGRDGPNILIAGSTGSGKSELLLSIVASLAVANRPDELALLLIDFKGGSAFGECGHLPHVLDLITELDYHSGGRLLTMLESELARRRQVLGQAGVTQFDDYPAKRGSGGEALPRLVIVLEEFASLALEIPELIHGLQQIARFGRSLGVHLLMATQRPSGVVTSELRANFDLRIALRMSDDRDSVAVLGAPDAAVLDRRVPGRGIIRVGGGALIPFQTARVGGGAPEDDELDPTAPTDVATLVSAIRDAAGDLSLADPGIVWSPDLPTVVTLDEVVTHASSPAGLGSTNLPFGLVDQPRRLTWDVASFDIESGRHLAVAGAPRSGRSTMLCTLAGSVATWSSPADCHLYVVDCGGGALQTLAGLPHVGDVVSRWETDRMGRLVRGLAGLVDTRLAAAPAPDLPTVMILFDRWESFDTQYGDVDGGRLVEKWRGILRAGPSVGVLVVMTGDHSLLDGRMSRLFEDKLVMRQRERSDFLSIGLPVRDVPIAMPEGRGFRMDDKARIQVALLTGDPSSEAQSAALRELIESARIRYAGLPIEHLPLSLTGAP